MMAACAALFCLTAVSCGGGDDGFSEEEYPTRIVGLWEFTKEYDAEDREWTAADPDDGGYYLRFNADGTGEDIEEPGDSGIRYTTSFRYSVSGSALRMQEDRYGFTSEYDIRLSANVLILIDKGDPLYDYEGKGDQMHFRRIE